MEGNPVKFGECVRDKRLTRIAELTLMNKLRECGESRRQGPKFRNEYGFGVFRECYQLTNQLKR